MATRELRRLVGALEGPFKDGELPDTAGDAAFGFDMNIPSNLDPNGMG
jgi:hypothetical protein